jgi:hypothetical protein
MPWSKGCKQTESAVSHKLGGLLHVVEGVDMNARHRGIKAVLRVQKEVGAA